MMFPTRYYIAVTTLLFTVTSCQTDPGNGSDEDKDHIHGFVADVNPAAHDFNHENSDSSAIAIADKVMEAMGGRKSWDSTRYLAWNFFDMRHLLWDKKEGDVRIKSLKDDMEIIVNINSMEGKVKKEGKEVSDPDSLQKYLEMGRNIWRNDSYWLVMPYKLKDSGVTLKYIRDDTTQSGEKADVLALSFVKVGHTPENKYLVWIDKDDHLVSQWAYYKDAGQDTANFIMPWKDYEKHGKILLSGNRGERKLSEIKVPDSVPEYAFTSLDPINWNNL